MRRRRFLGLASLGTAAAVAGGGYVGFLKPQTAPPVSAIREDIPTSSRDMASAIQRMTTTAPSHGRYLNEFQDFRSEALVKNDSPGELKRYLHKMENFEDSHVEDVFLPENQFGLLASSFKRIDRVQTLVGHGNFNVLGFDDMLRHATNHQSVGAFPQAELDFLEALFFDDVERYGFFGEKVVDSLTAVVNRRDRVKISRTGHYLFRGEPEKMYEKIRADVGESVVLTSGIRGIVKQTHLFLAKTIQSKGNLSLASRSLAPPGHSFHGIGDFDVGKVGFGAKNFTVEFSQTDEFKTLVDLGYLAIRYPENNLLGVRYEPWHIKVV